MVDVPRNVVDLAAFVDENAAPLSTALRTTAEYWEEAGFGSLSSEQGRSYRDLERRLNELVNAITTFGNDY